MEGVNAPYSLHSAAYGLKNMVSQFYQPQLSIIYGHVTSALCFFFSYEMIE